MIKILLALLITLSLSAEPFYLQPDKQKPIFLNGSVWQDATRATV